MRASVLLLLALLAALAVQLPGCSGESGTEPDREAARFVGRASCTECHAAQTRAFAGSHHDLAMQPAGPATVLGDFEGAEAVHGGDRAHFERRGEAFVVRTAGADGKTADFEVAYAFGVEPLQQYLVPLPGGRLQTLPWCWDTRPAEEGGQRWFHLYPDEKVPPGDALHWTGPAQNWNYMCAACHSTNLEKHYDQATGAYATSWSEIDVSCEACHGPGSRHLEWAQAMRDGTRIPAYPARGLTVVLKESEPVRWIFQPDRPTARRSPPAGSPESRGDAQLWNCARCHSRRIPLTEPDNLGEPYHDHYRLQLLQEGLYHADGQILDEVYVTGSFLQSRMHAEGVRCSDCHDPHGLGLVKEGNALCNQCHFPATFDVPAHHRHEVGTEAASCVACHMPARTYMVNDARRDHRFGVPRPDLSVSLGVPNACNGCHDDQSAGWAAEKVVEWYGPERRDTPHFAEALHAARNGAADARLKLVSLIADAAQSGIVRATALSLLAGYATGEDLSLLSGTIVDPDPLVRMAGVVALDRFPEAAKLGLGWPALTDPARVVRHEAVRLIAAAAGQLQAPQRALFDQAVEEFVATEMATADRAAAWLNLGVLYSRLGRSGDAESAYRKAIAMEPRFAEAAINLADLYRELGREKAGETTLRVAIELSPENPFLHHALGLLLVRSGRKPEALESLGRAASLAPDHARFVWVFALALHDSGETARALLLTEDALRRHPGNPDFERLRAELQAASAAAEGGGR